MTRRRILMIALLLLAAAEARAERPRARCEAVQLGQRTIGRVELAHFLDEELLRLVRLGLEGHFHVEIRLLRRRFAWFDDLEVTVSEDLVLTWDAASRRYVVDGLAVDLAALDPVRLERVPLGRRDATADSHYLEVDARLQVVTVASLRGVAGWVTGKGGSPSAVSRRLARMVVEDLIRRASGSCDVKIKAG